MHTIETGIATVAMQRNDEFSGSRYPYTYACDFLRTHWDIVPKEIDQQVPASDPRIHSRSEASRARQLWAEATGVEDEAAAQMLADAYLHEHGIWKPED